MGFREPFLMATGLDEKARRELFGRMTSLRETKPNAEPKSCKDSSTLIEKIKEEKFKTKIDHKSKSSIIIKDFNFPKTRGGEARVGWGKTWTKKGIQ